MEYKILSYLLFYPTEEFLNNLDTLSKEIQQCDINEKVKLNSLSFIKTIKERDIYDLQSFYVGSFDTNPSLSLYLFDHILGDSKERGQALVDLREEYLNNNFDISDSDLPDYLPLFLELLSQLTKEKAQELMAPLAELFNELYLRHKKVNSYYAPLFESLVLLTGNEIQEKEVSVLTAKEINDMWKEQEVNFTNNQTLKE